MRTLENRLVNSKCENFFNNDEMKNSLYYLLFKLFNKKFFLIEIENLKNSLL